MQQLYSVLAVRLGGGGVTLPGDPVGLGVTVPWLSSRSSFIFRDSGQIGGGGGLLLII